MHRRGVRGAWNNPRPKNGLDLAAAPRARAAAGAVLVEEEEVRVVWAWPEVRAPEGSRVSEVSDEGVRLRVTSELTVEAHFVLTIQHQSTMETTPECRNCAYYVLTTCLLCTYCMARARVLSAYCAECLMWV